ncbi:Glucose/arabinose dehydrogenase, beta-propeller fold [Marinobacter daqiaonensis]|uniref:Glucose/arabinose dehydrogenase, beta-propeller fold n=1 Tax=Marinobacter daqiaonensis TaxID=650891 RepID=A0A1I6J9Z1_9GAMM|nr:PQQ-dependent sugar dehydrogenase [Marinobacter daqiaonensis]SFR75779.1 Glucose/arabinose dehydrogenase, beta-propeller fold [Marinobacter daqiaonensis]
MEKRRPWSRIVLAFVVALVVGAALGSLVQTQINLYALQELGVRIPAGVRLQTTLEDLFLFGPVYLLIFGCGFLVSQLVAMAGTRYVLQRWRVTVCAIAAAVGLWATFKLVDAVAPAPTLFAATRTPMGMLAILVTAAVAGWLFASWPGSRKSGPGAGTAPLAVVLLTGLALTPAQAPRAETADTLRTDTVAEGLEHPWSIAFLPGGGMLVTERAGRLRMISADGELLPEPVAGMPEIFVSGQAGLFEVSLAPEFASSGRVYLSYACGTLDANHTCLARARLQGMELTEVQEIFRARPAKRGAAHYGGRIAWLEDGTLVLSLGDGFDYREEAQKLTSHIGTLVRLRQDGAVPADNPFVNQPDALPEIYSYGHRNVQGMVYDEDTHRLIVHEHGPRGGDEINIVRPGQNYGWPIATHGLNYTWAHVSPYTRYPGTLPPLLQWTPSIAPSGMTLYRGELFPHWQGDLLVGALAARQVHRVTLDGGEAREAEVMLGELNERIRDVRTGPDGAVYLLTDSAEGRVLRLTPP